MGSVVHFSYVQPCCFSFIIIIVKLRLATLAGWSCSILQTLNLISLLLVYKENKYEPSQFSFISSVYFQVFKKEPTHFPYFFKCVMEACLTGEELRLSLREQTVLLIFLDHCFNSLVCISTFITSAL